MFKKSTLIIASIVTALSSGILLAEESVNDVVNDIAQAGNKILVDDEIKATLFPEAVEIAKKAKKKAGNNSDIQYDMSFLKSTQVAPDTSFLFGSNEMDMSWATDIKEKVDETEHFYLFATRGQSIEELVDVFQAAANDYRAVVVFRGIYPDESLSDAYQDIRQIMATAKVLEDPPSVIIDPTLFKKFDIKEAPVTLLAKGDKLLVRATGSYSIDFIERQFMENDRSGDLGQYGETVVISEPDLIETMKERLSNLDMEGKKQKVIDGYWGKKEFSYLARAKEDKTRKLDPTMVVSQNIMGANGEIVVFAGERINPLDTMPFTTKLIVFDATNEKEVRYVTDLLYDYGANPKIQLITTALDRDDGWDQMSELEAKWKMPVYLLTPEVKQRFALRATPSLVEADSRYFYVKEFDAGYSEELKEKGGDKKNEKK